MVPLSRAWCHDCTTKFRVVRYKVFAQASSAVYYRIILQGEPNYTFRRIRPLHRLSQYTRRERVLCVPGHSTSLCERSFVYNSCIHYNALPARFKDLTLINFKKSLRSICCSVRTYVLLLICMPSNIVLIILLILFTRNLIRTNRSVIYLLC